MRLALAVLFACSGVASAEGFSLRVDGDAIIYSTADLSGESGKSPYLALSRAVREHSEVRVIVLEGDFTNIFRTLLVARVIKDNALATEVRTECSGTCIYMFLAGSPRNVIDGARLTARRFDFSEREAAKAFEDLRAKHGWSDDQTGYASFMFDLGQLDFRNAVMALREYGAPAESLPSAFGIDDMQFEWRSLPE